MRTQAALGILDSHRNTSESIGISGNVEAGNTHLGSHRNSWGSIGILGNFVTGGRYEAEHTKPNVFVLK